MGTSVPDRSSHSYPAEQAITKAPRFCPRNCDSMLESRRLFRRHLRSAPVTAGIAPHFGSDQATIAAGTQEADDGRTQIGVPIRAFAARVGCQSAAPSKVRHRRSKKQAGWSAVRGHRRHDNWLVSPIHIEHHDVEVLRFQYDQGVVGRRRDGYCCASQIGERAFNVHEDYHLVLHNKRAAVRAGDYASTAFRGTGRSMFRPSPRGDYLLG